MPKATFFNLDPEKREAVLQAAWEEFARHPFEQASLSRIVQDSRIAKGSMYQYFEDKLDLYLYMVELAYEQKRSYLKKAFALKADMFTILEEYYHQSYLFARDFPFMHRVINNFWDSRAPALEAELARGKLSRSQDFSGFLKEARRKGVVNPLLNPEAIFFVYHAVGRDLIEYFGDEANSRFVSDVLDVLKYGLQAREEGS
ncbi:MAG: TetR/AcrR family transcriptional regulator [Firmicutes bacterium]|nr:TetR/AcrR family transcriptional regulator [Bacillota bacterium]